MWNVLWWVMLVLYIPSCIGLIIMVLLQKGKGTNFAGAFGIGPGSDAVFGPRMGKSLPRRMTTLMAAVFMILSLTMTIVGGRALKGDAPDKVEAAELTQSGAPSELDALGLGTGTIPEDAAPTGDEAEAPEEAPTEELPTVDEAVTGDSVGEEVPAQPPFEEETVAEDAPPAEETPVAQGAAADETAEQNAE